MKKLSLKADKRKILGRPVKKLRKEGILPANVYGKKIKSQALQLDLKEFLAIYQQAGETGIIELAVEKGKKPAAVLIHNLQVDPVSDQPLHVDFRQVDLKEKVQVAIPVELEGEAPGVTKGGVLVQYLNEIEIEALPTDLPDKFKVDISQLEEIGHSISVKDLKIDQAKVKLLVDENQLVVKVEEPKEEEEEEKPPAEEVPAEGEGEGEKTEEEKPAQPGEKPAQAEKAPGKESGQKKPAPEQKPQPEKK